MLFVDDAENKLKRNNFGGGGRYGASSKRQVQNIKAWHCRCQSRLGFNERPEMLLLDQRSLDGTSIHVSPA